MKKVTVVGNNVAAIMSAITLAKKGYEITLVSPSKRLGGHFAGLELDGHTFDAGMNFLEFTSYNQDASARLASYDIKKRNDVGRFTTLVKQTLDEFDTFCKIDTPRMMFDDMFIPDLIISDNLIALRLLPDFTQKLIKKELSEIFSLNRKFHASRKLEFSKETFETLSLFNHGETFHKLFIEPFCKKLTGCSSADFVGLFHRSLWLPLFYPETLFKELDGTLPFRENHFYYPRNGSISSLIEKMEMKLKSFPNVTIVNKFIDESILDEENIVWTHDQNSFLSLNKDFSTYILEKTSIAISSLLIETNALPDNFSTLFIPNDNNLPFRVTNQSYCSGDKGELSKISVEWNAGTLQDKEQIAKNTIDALLDCYYVKRKDCVKNMRTDVFKNALTLPTASNIELCNDNFDLLNQEFPNIAFMGASSPFGASSFNDQIIQGLKVGIDL